MRQELVNKWKNNILSNSHQAEKAKLNLRLLLHGKGEKYDEKDDIWLPGSSHCEKIIRAVMAKDDKEWTIINESFSGNLNASEMSILGLSKAEIDEVADYLKYMRVEDVSALDFELNKDERLAIYQSHLIFGSENFSALPIHEKVNGGLSSLDEYSFLDGGYRDIPQEVERDLKFFKKSLLIRLKLIKSLKKMLNR